MEVPSIASQGVAAAGRGKGARGSSEALGAEGGAQVGAAGLQAGPGSGSERLGLCLEKAPAPPEGGEILNF